MTFETQVSRALDADHAANLDLLARLEQALANAPTPGAAPLADLVRLTDSLASHLCNEIDHHFAFEEQEIFPRLAEAGDGDLADLLDEEHVAIRAVAEEYLPLAGRARANMLEDADWRALKRVTMELTERLRAHIDKETMALLPAIDTLLEPDTDREMAFAYMAS